MRPQRRKKSLPEGRSPPECRIMSLTCFKCDVNHKMRGACLVAGCSDGVIRYTCISLLVGVASNY